MFEVPNLDDMSVDPKDYTEASLVLAQLAACHKPGRGGVRGNADASPRSRLVRVRNLTLGSGHA